MQVAYYSAAFRFVLERVCASLCSSMFCVFVCVRACVRFSPTPKGHTIHALV